VGRRPAGPAQSVLRAVAGSGSVHCAASRPWCAEPALSSCGYAACQSEYGPAQRMYGRRGYIPDGRGAGQGQRPLSEGTQVRLDHDVIIWLTKELAS
jgi:hypothetical protein